MESKRAPGAVVGPEAEEELERERQLLGRFWRAIEEIGERNKDEDPDEVMRIVTEVVEEVRQEHYERERREAQGGR